MNDNVPLSLEDRVYALEGALRILVAERSHLANRVEALEAEIDGVIQRYGDSNHDDGLVDALRAVVVSGGA